MIIFGAYKDNIIDEEKINRKQKNKKILFHLPHSYRERDPPLPMLSNFLLTKLPGTKIYLNFSLATDIYYYMLKKPTFIQIFQSKERRGNNSLFQPNAKL